MASLTTEDAQIEQGMLGELAKMASEGTKASCSSTISASPAEAAPEHGSSPNQYSANQSTAYVGVSWHKSTRKWQAKIQYDGKRRHLGYFGTKEEAARKYDEFAVLQGRPLNFPAASPVTANTTNTTAATTTTAAKMNVAASAHGALNYLSRVDGRSTEDVYEESDDDEEAPAKRSKIRAISPYMGKRSSEYVGVTWHKDRQNWEARITVDNNELSLGRFENEKDAAKKYDEYAAIYGKPVNFPQQEGQQQAMKNANYGYTRGPKPSNFVGVSWDQKAEKWQVKISIQGKKQHLGQFASETEAAHKYDEQAALHGKPLNFPWGIHRPTIRH
jgi:hypothetical protein